MRTHSFRCPPAPRVTPGAVSVAGTHSPYIQQINPPRLNPPKIHPIAPMQAPLPLPLMLPGDVEKNEKISAAKLNQSMVELVERYRDDPVGFVEDIILRGQPGDWVLQDWQKEFLGAVARGRGASRSGRDME